MFHELPTAYPLEFEDGQYADGEYEYTHRRHIAGLDGLNSPDARNKVLPWIHSIPAGQDPDEASSRAISPAVTPPRVDGGLSASAGGMPKHTSTSPNRNSLPPQASQRPYATPPRPRADSDSQARPAIGLQSPISLPVPGHIIKRKSTKHKRHLSDSLAALDEELHGDGTVISDGGVDRGRPTRKQDRSRTESSASFGNVDRTDAVSYSRRLTQLITRKPAYTATLDNGRLYGLGLDPTIAKIRKLALEDSATPRVQEPTARSPDRNIKIERDNSSTKIAALARLSREPPLGSIGQQPHLVAHRDSSLLLRGGDSVPRKFSPYPSFSSPSGVHNISSLPLYSSPEQHQATAVAQRCSHGHEGASDAGDGRPNGGIFHDQKLCQLLDASGKPGLGREVRKLIRKAVEERVQELSKLAQDEAGAHTFTPAKTSTPAWARALFDRINMLEAKLAQTVTTICPVSHQLSPMTPPTQDSSDAISKSSPAAAVAVFVAQDDRTTLDSLLFAEQSPMPIIFKPAPPPDIIVQAPSTTPGPSRPTQSRSSSLSPRLPSGGMVDVEQEREAPIVEEEIPRILTRDFANRSLPPTPRIAPQDFRTREPWVRGLDEDAGLVEESFGFEGWEEQLQQEEMGPRPWDLVTRRLYAWAIIWTEREFSSALEEISLDQQVNPFALSIWTTVSFKRFLRNKLCVTPPETVDKLFVPPSMSDVLNQACYKKQFDEAKTVLNQLWAPFSLDKISPMGMPRVIIALCRHRNEDDAWAVHRFDLRSSTLTSYLFYAGERRRLADGRPFAWWHAIRAAWPGANVKHPDHLGQKIEHIQLPVSEANDASLAAVNCFRNVLLGWKWDRSTDLAKLRELIWFEVKRLMKKKGEGRLIFDPVQDRDRLSDI